MGDYLNRSLAEMVSHRKANSLRLSGGRLML
jgi:hypothetical protein